MKEIIKDTERQERLNQVYRHLFAHFNIDSQTKFADALHVQRTALSAAMNGNKAYLTNNLFTKICAAFPGVFNYEYLTKGVGSLLSIKENVKDEEIDKSIHQVFTPMDISLLIEKAVEKATDYAEKALAAQERNIKMLEDKKNYYEISEVLGYNYEDIKDILIDIKRRKSWTFISCNYNFENDKISNNRTLSVDQVKIACEIYETNPKATASTIFKALNMEFDNKKERERMRHIVDSIKEHKAYNDISKNYNF